MATIKKKTQPYVVVRTYSAGVHVGELVRQSEGGKRVELASARRIWSWKGANTLHEIALRGVAAGSRVSETVTAVILTDAIEIICCAPEGETALRSAKWAA
jgi:hypothetical protein